MKGFFDGLVAVRTLDMEPRRAVARKLRRQAK